MENVSRPGNISLKILLVKIIFLFWILLCYLLTICRRSVLVLLLVVPLCGVLLFHFSVIFQLFRQRSVVSPDVPSVFSHYSGIPCSVFCRVFVFKYSWFYSTPCVLYLTQSRWFAHGYNASFWLILCSNIWLKVH